MNAASAKEARVNIRNVVLIVVALTAASPAAGRDRAVSAQAQLPRSDIPYREQAILVANVENAVRTLVPADKTSGVSQILSLVGHTNFEEQWAFVPAINLWIEIGKNESVSELDSEVEVDTGFLSEIVALYHSVEIYHFHPAGFYRRIWQGAAYPVDAAVAAIDPSQLQPVGFALPSPNDVVSSIDLAKMLSDIDPSASITYAVVSPHGVVTYGPTASGLRTMIYDWGNPRATLARSVVTRLAIRRMPFNIASTVDAMHGATIGEVIEALCAQATDENYRLSFTPFKLSAPDDP